MKRRIKKQALLATCFLARAILGPEGEGDMFFRNDGSLLTNYSALYPRRQNSVQFHNWMKRRFPINKEGHTIFLMA
jgi:hypothetical protein